MPCRTLRRRSFESAPVNFHQSPASPKQPDLHRVDIQMQNVPNFLHRESCHFFHHQHSPILILELNEEPIEQIAMLGTPGSIDAAVTENALAVFRQPLHLTNLLFAKVSLIDQGPHLFFAEVVPAFVYGDLIEPRTERRTQIKALQRKVRFQERLLRYILNVFAPPHDAADNGQEARLMDADQFLVRKLVAGLSSLDQFALGTGAARTAAR